MEVTTNNSIIRHDNLMAHLSTNGGRSLNIGKDHFFSRDLGILNGTNSAPLFTERILELGSTVNLVAFSSFENSFDIFACVTQEFVYIFRIVRQQSEDASEELKFDCQRLSEYKIGAKSTAIAFSPQTNFNGQVDRLCFAVAVDSFNILVLSQLFNDDTTPEPEEQHCISGHTDYINDMAFEPLSGETLASTSDDCTCCVWSVNSETLEMKIILSSPGINVKWHPSEPKKLFVSEKKGLIRFYDTDSRVAVMSFDCHTYPLLASDWCHDASEYIGCAAGKDLFFWNTSLTSLPIKVIKTNTEGLTEFKFYDNKLVAYRGRPNNFLTVKNFNNNQVYIDKQFVSGHGISWNRKMPILAVGALKTVRIYKINTH